jgi:seryl-tRNA synthetase
MLQIQLIREKPQWVKERLAVKNFTDTNLVDEILALDEQRKKLQQVFDSTQAQVNSASKEIGQLMAKGQKDDAETRKKEVSRLKEKLEPIKADMAQTESALHNKLLLLPNLPSEKVPPGKSAADNVVVREGGKIPELPEGSLPHWDLVKKYDLLDFETAARIAGSGFVLYKGKGARLQRALVQYFLDYNIGAGYTEYAPPYLVNETTAFGTGQLPDKEGQMYFIKDDDLYLIPTSEVPLVNVFRDTILKETDLPIKMTAWSPCFRREAGSFGKEVRGLNRVHQFDKVELVQIVHPDKSYDALEEMVNHVEKLIQSLELPYRILKLCGGDMGFASAMTYDFEVYSTAQARWLEVSSVSNCETFQTNRMKIRFKDEKGKTQLLHALNGSSLALPRIVACLLENNQSAEGIKIPPSLTGYFGEKIINTLG